MRKIITTFAIAISLTMQAQTTPETIMSWCPSLPTADEMIRFQAESAHEQTLTQPELFNDFADKLKAAQAKANAVFKKETVSTEKVMASKTSGTDMTVAQASQLSEAQARQLAQNKMTSTMTGLGLSAEDMARMQSGDLSEAEQMALANKVMMAQTGGISMEDIQRMEHMSDAERAQYLQQSGKLASTSAKAQQNQPALQKQQQKTALVNKMQEYDRQLSAGHNEYRAIRERAIKAGRNLYNNSYKARYESLEAQKQRAVSEGALDEMSPNEAAYQRFMAASNQQTELMCDFYRQYIPTYRKAIVDQMAYCKNTLLPAAKGHQQTVDELYRLTGEVQYAISTTEVTATAALYLETPEALQDYEIDFLNFK